MYTGFSQTFDRASHSVLIQKLAAYGVASAFNKANHCISVQKLAAYVVTSPFSNWLSS